MKIETPNGNTLWLDNNSLDALARVYATGFASRTSSSEDAAKEMGREAVYDFIDLLNGK